MDYLLAVSTTRKTHTQFPSTSGMWNTLFLRENHYSCKYPWLVHVPNNACNCKCTVIPANDTEILRMPKPCLTASPSPITHPLQASATTCPNLKYILLLYTPQQTALPFLSQQPAPLMPSTRTNSPSSTCRYLNPVLHLKLFAIASTPLLPTLPYASDHHRNLPLHILLSTLFGCFYSHNPSAVNNQTLLTLIFIIVVRFRLSISRTRIKGKLSSVVISTSS